MKNESGIDVLAVDYKMAESGVVTYNGNEVVDMLYERKRYFPVFMITSHITRAMNNMNDVFLINDKDCIYKPEMLPGIVQKIKGAVASYRRRIAEIDERCRCLESKQNSDEGLTPSEEKELLSLHVEQNAIDPKGNPLSPDKLQTQSLKELQELVKNSRELLESLSQTMLFREHTPQRRDNIEEKKIIVIIVFPFVKTLIIDVDIVMTVIFQEQNI